MVAKGKTPKHADQYRDRTAGRGSVKGTPVGDLEHGRSIQALARTAAALEDALSHAYFGDLSSESIQAGRRDPEVISASRIRPSMTRAAIRAFLLWSQRTKQYP